MTSLLINGHKREVSAPGDMPLLWVLRDILGMAGTKFGCGIAQCGACTVHLDGEATQSCVLPLDSINDKSITTIEGIGGTLGLILGLGTAMYNEITRANGAVQQSNFDNYRALRMNETPKIEVHLIRSGEDPGGIGEAGTAAAASALGNAIFAATGRRVRNLSFGNAKLGQA